MDEACIATYTVQIFGPEDDEEKPYRWLESDKRVLADLPAMLEHAEENIQTLLPEGYKAVIKEWDAV